MAILTTESTTSTTSTSTIKKNPRRKKKKRRQAKSQDKNMTKVMTDSPRKIATKTIEAVRLCSIRRVAQELGFSVGRDNKILSPFVTEKTPSCLLNKDDRTFKCFSSDEHGDVIRLWQVVKSASFYEAVVDLAEIFSITVEYDAADPNAPPPVKRAPLYEALDMAATLYAASMPIDIIKALAGRGISAAQITRWQIGYGAGNLRNQCNGCATELCSLGILNEAWNDTNYKRIVFPIHNADGKVVGFTARSTTAEKGIPKYINSRNSAVYDKSKILYGLHLCKERIRKTGVATLVEGCTDAIALDRDGEQWNAVSTLSKTFSNEQAALLMRCGCETLNVMYDADTAGQDGTEKAIGTALANGLMPYVVALPEGLDPDNWVNLRANGGAEEHTRTDGVVWFVGRKLADKKDKPFEYDKGLTAVAELLCQCGNESVRDMYVGQVLSLFKLDKKIFGSKIRARLQEMSQAKRESTRNKSSDNTEQREVLRKGYSEAKNFLRVGTDYFKLVWKYDQRYKIYEQQLVKWTDSAIRQDYVEKGFVNFFDYIPKFDDFGMSPNFRQHRQVITIAHQGVTSQLFNLCHPLPHEPKQGAFPTIIGFLMHLFGSTEKPCDWFAEHDGDVVLSSQERPDLLGNPIMVIKDYYRLKLQTPTQILPVICLVSNEQETGKSTLLKFNTDLFGANACIIGKEHLESQFNGTYAKKLMIGIDEAFIGIEKKAAKERIKKLATDETIIMNLKGVEAKELPYYGSLVFCSNDEKDFMQIESTDKRFWIVKVKAPTVKDPDLRSKMVSELPAFIHYCMNTPVFHPKETRSWFNDRYLRTAQRDEVAYYTRRPREAVIQDFITNLFLTYRVTEIKIGLDSLEAELNKIIRPNITKLEIGNFFRKQGYALGNPTSESYPTGFVAAHANETQLYAADNISRCPPKVQRVFRFNVADKYWTTLIEQTDPEYFGAALVSGIGFESQPKDSISQQDDNEIPF